MSPSTNSTVNIVVENIFIFIGIPMLVLGVLGGIFNFAVFMSLKTFRQSACAFFLAVMSLVNIGQLLFSFMTRIMITGFNFDWTDGSVAFCKLRNYFLQLCGLLSYTCMCLATVDQFMATSLRVQWQQFFTIRKAYGFCAVFFTIWFLECIPTLVWYDLALSPTTGTITCMITDANFNIYIAYVYLLIFNGILPTFITIIFGCLAYWNVRQIPYRAVPLVRRELDKQLTSMVLLQVVFNVFYISPFIVCLFLIYTIGANSSSLYVYNLNFAYDIILLIYYLYYVTPFYIYVCVSRRFRQQFLFVFTNIYHRACKRQARQVNQVSPGEEEQ